MIWTISAADTSQNNSSNNSSKKYYYYSHYYYRNILLIFAIDSLLDLVEGSECNSSIRGVEENPR